MADYWKSQDRKFCDFCKCWLADNKPSIEFHERGKRHKENVEKKIKEISKKSQRDFKAQQKMDEDIRKMELAGMKAYMLDVHAKADYSSQFMALPEDFKPPGEETSSSVSTVPTAEEVEAETSEPGPDQFPGSREPGPAQFPGPREPGPSQMPHPRQPGELRPPPESRPRKMAAGAAAALPRAKPPTLVGIQGEPMKHVKNYVHQKKLPKWREARGDDDKIYYWNTLTQDTSWEKPAGGYVSLELQEKYLNDDKDKRKKQEEQWQIVKNPLRVPLPHSQKPDPYGKWSTVLTESECGEVDLELPNVDKPDLQVPVLTDELPQVNFKEKQITCLDDSASNSQPGTFKKRKMQRFNVRQRIEDDD